MITKRHTLPAALDPHAIVSSPIHPFRAYRALQRLIRDKEDTALVFEIVESLSGRATASGYEKMLRSREGARQAYLGEELAEALKDDTWLDAFGPNTVGACYREFMAARNLSADGLVEASRSPGDRDGDIAHPLAWFGRRLRDLHDIWHVLTGYNTDTLGAGCLLGFTYAQTGNHGVGFIAVAGAWELTKSYRYQPYAGAVFEGWRLGRRAEWLPALDYKHLFAMPLDAVRRSLRLSPPTVYASVPLEARGAYRYLDERENQFAGENLG